MFGGGLGLRSGRRRGRRSLLGGLIWRGLLCPSLLLVCFGCLVVSFFASMLICWSVVYVWFLCEVVI